MPTLLRPDDPDIQKLERLAVKGTSEDEAKTLAQLLQEEPEDNATQVAEVLETPSTKVVSSAAPSPTTINLFQHPDAHPYVLDVALLRRYGPVWMGWEPDLLEAKILLDFHTRSISDLTRDKIQALKTLHLVDTFWDSWLVFVPCAMALSGVHADFRVLNALTVPQAMIAVDIAAKLRTDVPYSLDVRTYLAVVHLHDGMVCPIEPLTDIVDVDTSRYDLDVPKIRAQWDAVRKDDRAPEGLTPEAVQLQRMLEAHHLLEESRQHLSDQLPLVYHA